MISRKLSRGEFYASIGLFKEVDPITQEAYDFVEKIEREKPNRGAAAGDNWHISYHGSSFPGDDPTACPRKALYTMMDAPRKKSGRWLTSLGDVGKDVENRIVGKWYRAGYLVSAPPPPYGNLQTVYEDSEHWLTSTVDAEILPLKSDTIIVAELKSKFARDIDKMLRLCKGPDPAHIKQVKTQIGLSREQGPRKLLRCYNTGRLAISFGKKYGKDIIACPQHGHDKCLQEYTVKPPKHGRLYYFSRDDPTNTREFFYEYDKNFMEVGRKQLKIWKAYWLKDLLPQTDFTGKHPFGWNWTTPESPCRWCDFSKAGNGICNSDHETAKALGKMIQLSQSSAIEEAQIERPEYSYDLVRAAVEKRWLV